MELRAEIEKHSERINRYIVGCKLSGIHNAAGQRKRINRYIVGCKYE